MEELIQALSRRAERANGPKPGDYIGKDGRLYCGKCHTPKETATLICGKRRPCSCQCHAAEQEAAYQAAHAGERAKRLIETSGVPSGPRFQNAVMTPALRVCREWVENWEEMRKKNSGLLLWGDVGTWKTYAAHCVCNALLRGENPYSVYATSISRVLSGGFDKTEIIDKVRSRALVVFDDLGAERGNDYALETIFTLVDERYRAKKPLIVTSNVTMDDMKDPVITQRDGQVISDIRRKRIYDRILEMCVPVLFEGESKRPGIAAGKKREMRRMTGARHG